MPRRSPANRLPITISLAIGLLALFCFAAAPALAADENEPVITLTTVMHNFDAQPAQKFSTTLRDGTYLWGGWFNVTQRNAFLNYFPGTKLASKMIITPYVTFTKSYGKRCWVRKRERFASEQVDSLKDVDMNTVVRKSENQLLFQELRDGTLSQVTITYDLVTLLPSRFEIAARDEQTGETLEIIQTVTYATPTSPPRPGRVCKRKKR